MARLTDKQREDIRNALIFGDSQYKVTHDFEVSSATVNKIYKTIEPDEFLAKEVKAEVAIKSKLNQKSESLVKGFDDKVKDELRRKNLVYGTTEKAVQKASELLDGLDSASDLKAIIDGVDKASLTLGVNQRHAKTEINNTNAQQTVSEIVIRDA